MKAAKIKQYIYKYQSPLGEITLACEGEALIGLWFEGQKYFGASLDARREEWLERIEKIEGIGGMQLVLGQAVEWLDMYFGGKVPDFVPKLSLEGSPFRNAVWEVLLGIPYGQVMTYKEIAAVIAKQEGLEHMSAQAVGGAVGHNPISLIVPCHRVIGSDGSLTGYAGGVDKKEWLLAWERSSTLGTE